VDAPEDSSLVRRAQAGCLPAYEELAARHAGRAYRTALRMLGNHHDAQDVAQEALVAAWQGLVEFRADASADAVATAITELPVSQRTALVLHLYEGMSYADIAEIAHSTVPAVRSHLHRARQSLATTLRGWE
jgi:RNA polymerase sigma-70 factor, ECF subfamily